MKPSMPERIFTGLWHLALFGIGLYELRHHQSRSGKFFAGGMAIWHLDAFQADIRGEECLTKQMLRAATGRHECRTP